jgi:hypothetical protein
VCTVEGGCATPPPPHPQLAGLVTIYANTTVLCSPDSSMGKGKILGSMMEKGCRHGLINYKDTKTKCRHLKKLTSKGTLWQAFISVYRLDIQSLISHADI